LVAFLALACGAACGGQAEMTRLAARVTAEKTSFQPTCVATTVRVRHAGRPVQPAVRHCDRPADRATMARLWKDVLDIVPATPPTLQP
jgi:hypothetical protein